ncbi:MAG TPA: 2-amino-4-hydroxy-6-hydroxymethyldihydropteridine diphosphokinase [Candidatus Tectomicrobia bacterium]|nr:2-amino-4-hydroxy-6-hydroxymethyldihydropteridine diphosphokinase [Candidatus Tectomicrobia bacterium]
MRAFIGLGSNVGDRLGFLQQAVMRLREVAGVQVTKASSVYETEPVGPVDQAWFLNAVVEVETSLSPHALLDQTQQIERGLGRDTTYRWGPRTIDLDILLHDDIQVKTATLEIPHAELCHRAFVMIPLLELDPDLSLPDGTVVKLCLNTLTESQQVRIFAPPPALAS